MFHYIMPSLSYMAEMYAGFFSFFSRKLRLMLIVQKRVFKMRLFVGRNTL